MNVQTLKGFRDFLPAEARKRQFVMNTFKKAFESFGFEPLETPVLEYEEILTGKYGEEGDKLMYRFEDHGKRRVAMRYDQTVPLARVTAQYQNELPMPFKRYQIQNVWRAENTQKGRYREFTQCDIDIVGLSSLLADAEIIATAIRSLQKLGFSTFRVLLNDRSVFTQLVEQQFVSEKQLLPVVASIDKLKKIGEDGVVNELGNKGIETMQAREILQKVRNSKEQETVVGEIKTYLKNFSLGNAELIFEPTLARGLDYYTGLIFEIEIPEYPVGSVCGGGRYDNLIGMFAKKQVPAVGCAFGFDRTMEAMDALNLFPQEIVVSSTKVLVTIFNKNLANKSLEVSVRLREKNIPTELWVGEIKEKNPLEKQLKYANAKGITSVVIIGPEEAEKNMGTVKNLKTTEQKQLPIDELIKFLHNN